MHHYVPQCYLRNFSRKRDKPQLAVVDRVARKQFQVPPAKVAVERDFHRIEAEGLPPDALESAFSKFESKLSESLNRIIATRSVANEEDFTHVLNLIALMSVKNPRQRGLFNDFQRDLFTRVMELVTSSPEIYNSQMRQARDAGALSDGEPVSYEEMREFVRSRRFEIEIPTTRSLAFELDTFDVVLRTLVDRKWVLLRAKANSPGFITSDHPVCLTWSHPPTGPAIFGPGHAMRGTELLFPISSSLAIVGAFELEPAEVDISELGVALFNAKIISYAERQVYAQSFDFTYRWHPQARLRKGTELLSDPRFLQAHSRTNQRPSA